LRHEPQPAEETLGMLGRTYKDLAIAAATPDQRAQFLRQAAETYAEAYRTSGGYWSGINAATMNLLVGQTAQASELAQKVRKQCLKELKNRTGDSYWEFGALGEDAFLRDSVEIGSDSRKWRVRFDSVVARAARVITASNQRLEIGGISYEFCNQLLLGLATIRCRQLEGRLIPLAVWNQQPGDGPG